LETAWLAPRPKTARGRSLGGDEGDLQLGAGFIRPLGGHQSKLVQRQRPCRRPRSHERQPLDIAALDILDQAVELLIDTAVIDGHDMSEAHVWAGSERQQQRVIAQRLASVGVGHALLRVHPAKALTAHLGPQIGRDLRQRVALSRRVGKRLLHRHRPIDEVLPRSQQRDPHQIARQLPQRQRRLQRAHTAARDHHLKRCAAILCRAHARRLPRTPLIATPVPRLATVGVYGFTVDTSYSHQADRRAPGR